MCTSLSFTHCLALMKFLSFMVRLVSSLMSFFT